MYHVHCNKYMSHTWLQTPMGLNHLVQRTSCRISIGRPLDFTGRPVGFYWMSTRILQVCFKGLRIANFIEKCNKKFYWTSIRNSTRRPGEIFFLRFSMKLAILRHLKQTYKILVDIQQNPTERPLESRGRPIEVLQDVLQTR